MVRFSARVINNEGAHVHNYLQISLSGDQGQLMNLNDINHRLNNMRSDLHNRSINGNIQVTLRTREGLFHFRAPIDINGPIVYLQRLHVIYDQLIADENNFLTNPDLRVITNVYFAIEKE
jgi:hypothetical protein